MNKLIKARRFCRVIPASEVLFEVDDTNKWYIVNNKKSYVVNLEDHTCDCGLWQISGLPYSHAMPCITYLRAIYELYAAICFTKEAFLKFYSGIIHSLLDKSKWLYIEAMKSFPQMFIDSPSRPKTCRRRELGEKPPYKRKFFVSWIHCRGIEHNKICCPHNPANVNKNTRTMMVKDFVQCS